MHILNAQQIGKMVKFHRKKSGLTQAELGKLAEIGKTVVLEIEKGKITVKLETLLKLLNVLNIKINFQSPIMHFFEEEINEKG